MNNRFLNEGDVVEIKKGHEIYTKIPKHFYYENTEGDFELDRVEVLIGEEYKRGFDTTYLEGRYIVVRTEMTGGGIGHGSHDTYPDGHKVTCQKADNKKVEIEFFQSGCFTAMIEPGEIEIVGKAKATWDIQSDD